MDCPLAHDRPTCKLKKHADHDGYTPCYRACKVSETCMKTFISQLWFSWFASQCENWGKHSQLYRGINPRCMLREGYSSVSLVCLSCLPLLSTIKVLCILHAQGTYHVRPAKSFSFRSNWRQILSHYIFCRLSFQALPAPFMRAKHTRARLATLGLPAFSAAHSVHMHATCY